MCLSGISVHHQYPKDQALVEEFETSYGPDLEGPLALRQPWQVVAVIGQVPGERPYQFVPRAGERWSAIR